MGKGSTVDELLNDKKLELYDLALRYGKALMEKLEKDTELEEERRKEMKAPPAFAHFMASGDCDHPGLRMIHDYASASGRGTPEKVINPDLRKALVQEAQAAVVALACLDVFACNGVVSCPTCSLVVSTELVKTGELWGPKDGEAAEV